MALALWLENLGNSLNYYLLQTNAPSHSYYLQNIYEISTQFAGYFESIIQCFYETGEQLDFDGTKPSKTIYTNSIDKT